MLTACQRACLGKTGVHSDIKLPTLVGGSVWIKCRQSGKCPVCGCGKLCKEYSRAPSKFSVFGDSALDCESKLLLARQLRENISLVLPYHLYCKPNAKWFWLRSLGMIWNRISDPRSVWIMVHQMIGKYTLVMDSPFLLMHHDPDRSWITDPDPDHPKGTNPVIFGN